VRGVCEPLQHRLAAADVDVGIQTARCGLPSWRSTAWRPARHPPPPGDGCETVHHHVSAVLSKIGVPTRMAAAREAARMGIAAPS
jgi:hypothetical protein